MPESGTGTRIAHPESKAVIIPTSKTRAASGVFAYIFAPPGRLASLSNPFGKTSAWTYRNDNSLVRKSLGNGAYTDFAPPNPLGQTSAMTNYATDGTVRSQYAGGSYDGKGLLRGFAANIPGMSDVSGAHSYDYDAKGQLTQDAFTPVTGAAVTNSYAYDLAGNRNSVSTGVDDLNQLLGTGYVYDDNGNPITYNGKSLAYDLENRLITRGNDFCAGYTGNGLRAWKEQAGIRNYYLYDGMTPIAELDSVGNVNAVNTWGADGLLARDDARGERWYQFDPFGNTAQRSDPADQLLSVDTYDAWGQPLSNGDTADPYGYRGQFGYYTDHFTDNTPALIWCSHRYYDPEMGRWLTPDPIGYAGGLNLYEYCGNNPVNAIDPTGWAAGGEDVPEEDGNGGRGVDPEDMSPSGILKLVDGILNPPGGPLVARGGTNAEDVPYYENPPTIANPFDDVLNGEKPNKECINIQQSWSTERSNYWKLRAEKAPELYTEEQLQRMREGQPPLHQVYGVPKELHHIVPQRIGGSHDPSNLEEYWPWEHDTNDPYRYYKGPKPPEN